MYSIFIRIYINKITLWTYLWYIKVKPNPKKFYTQLCSGNKYHENGWIGFKSILGAPLRTPPIPIGMGNSPALAPALPTERKVPWMLSVRIAALWQLCDSKSFNSGPGSGPKPDPVLAGIECLLAFGSFFRPRGSASCLCVAFTLGNIFTCRRHRQLAPKPAFPLQQTEPRTYRIGYTMYLQRPSFLFHFTTIISSFKKEI